MNLERNLEFYGLTDPGRKRSHNEDSIGSDKEIGVAVLADGMGGYKAGEVASSIAVQMILDELRESLKIGSLSDDEGDSGFTEATIKVKLAIEKANKTIYQTAQSQPQCAGMGTTLVTAVFYDNRMTIAHIGDSRLYRLRGADFQQVTSDHSLLQELIDKGFYTPEEAKKSLNKNLVTRAMGIELSVTPDLQEDVVLPGDIYLMCSDGLSDLVDDSEMHETLRAYGTSLESVAQRLIQLANDKGGKDNISVILARVIKPFTAKKSWYSKVFDWF